MTTTNTPRPTFKVRVHHLTWRIGQMLLPKARTRERAWLRHQRHIEFLEEDLQYCSDILEDPYSTPEDIEHARFELARAEPDLALTRITQVLHRHPGPGVKHLDHDQYRQIVASFYKARDDWNRPGSGVVEHERFVNFRDAIVSLNRIFLRLPQDERPLLVPEEELLSK